MGNTRLFRGFLSPFRREHLAGASQRKSAAIPVVAKEKSTAGFFFSFICGKIFFFGTASTASGGG